MFDLELPNWKFGLKVLIVLAVIVLAFNYVPGMANLKKYFGLS